MMVSPLGPFMSKALAFAQSDAGWVTGSYTAAAAVSGFAGAFFLDRFERKLALSVALVGLAAGTLAGAFAWSLHSLLAARVLAGLFGGPATSIAMSIIADVVPTARRGKAMGKVMGAFAAASVLGVPFGLELAQRVSWRAPFVFTAGLGLAVSGVALARLPVLRGHIDDRRERSMWGELRTLAQAEILLSFGMTWVAMGASFVLVPNIAAYTLLNLGFPAGRLGLLYMAGGALSFATMRAVGPLVDRFGSARVGTVGTLLLTVVIVLGFALTPPAIPVVAIFMGFMFSMSIRNLSYNTLTSKVPEPSQRAAFMSVQSAVQHLASATGAIVSATLLAERADRSLVGMDRVALLSVGLGLLLPPMLFAVEARVRRRAEARS
ncbi:MAG: MFS transporter [Myxococcales bacterium]|nr:MFS transporter [Myxococcales bacterium]MBL0195404.1 MFS transporter [Myxococcales bacterium]